MYTYNGKRFRYEYRSVLLYFYAIQIVYFIILWKGGRGVVIVSGLMSGLFQRRGIADVGLSHLQRALQASKAQVSRYVFNA